MKILSSQFGKILIGMRSSYKSGENAMEYARLNFEEDFNTPITTLIAYDLQSGTYVNIAKANPEYINSWCAQIANSIEPYLCDGDTIMEVGCGEATTLAGVMMAIRKPLSNSYGFDISWSRCAHGIKWLNENQLTATLFVGDLFSIPLADSSIDVVYTSHSLEPNGGREIEAINELLRVARKAVVLIEPAYEFASAEAQARMLSHGYVTGLKAAADHLDCDVDEHRLLPFISNHLNPSGLLALKKKYSRDVRKLNPWQCPITNTPLTISSQGYYSEESGLVYPLLKSIPLIRAEHAIIASSFMST